MQVFWKSFNFFAKRLFSTWYVYIFVFMLIGMNIFVWVIFPVIRGNVTLDEIFRYRYFFGIIILIMAVISIIITAKTFIANIYNGSDILMITKILNRTKLVYSKILVVLTFIIGLSLLTTMVNLSTLKSPFDLNGVANFVVLGTFIGSLTIGLIFTALTLLIGLFCKELTTILVIITIEAVLFALQMIMNFVVVGPGVELKNKDQIDLNPINLVSKPNGDKLNQTQVLLAEYQGQPITLNTKFKGMPLKFKYDNLNTFIEDEWDKFDKQTKVGLKDAFSLQTSWSNLFVWYTHQFRNNITFLTTPDRSNFANRIQTSQNESMLWNIKFNSSYGYKTIINDNDVDGFSVKNNNFKRDFVLTANRELLIKKRKKAQQIEYFSQPTISLHSDISIDPNNLTYPIFEFDMKTMNFKENTFADLNEFAKYYYGSEQLKISQKFIKVLDSHRHITDANPLASYYYSILLSYFVQKNDINLNKLKADNINPNMDLLNELITNFQYTTFNFLKEYFNNPQQYSWVDSDALHAMISVLDMESFHTNRYSTHYNKSYHFVGNTVYLGKPQELITTMINMHNRSSFNANNWVKLVPSLTLTPLDLMETMVYAQQTQFINNDAVLAFWLSLSGILFLVSVAVYTKRDFY